MSGRARLAFSTVAAVATAWSGLSSPAAATTADVHTYVAVVAEADGGLSVTEFRASARQFDARVRDLSDDGQILNVDLDQTVEAFGSVDPRRPSQWALDQTSFEAAWPLTDGTGAIVAVLDTGVQANHEDLAGQVLMGWDTITETPGAATDPDGHGTHVAGIIAAAAGNGKGIAGAAPGVRILPVRVLDENGSGKLADILEGIIWAADHGADVINLSLGGGGNEKTYAAAINHALNKGAVVVAAAGNNGDTDNKPRYPAADPAAVAVASVTSSGNRSSFSNHGPHVDIAAPGSSILSTVPASGYSSWSGTSMATPYASAAAALVAARHPGFTPGQIRDVIERSARDLGAPGRDDEFGAGMIDPAAALALADPPPAPNPGPSPVQTQPNTPLPQLDPPSAPTETPGYWVVAADGRVQRFGSAPALGEAPAGSLAAPIVAAAATPSGRGYWLAGADGAVLAFGDAAFLGSPQPFGLTAPIVGMAATPTGAGYWLLGRDGGVFSFGDAAFFGSTGDMILNRPVVDMVPTPTGRGYWLVASDGGVFAFGDAGFRGSTGAMQLNRPIVSLTASAGGGYWMVASDGGIFAFDVPFHGSLPGLAGSGLPDGQRIRATDAGAGYYILGADGTVFSFGAARHLGSPRDALPAVDLILASS